MKKILSILMLSLVVISSLFIVSAYKGDITQKSPNYDVSYHDQMQEAFSNLDYESWKSIMENKNPNSRVLSVVNQDNFEIFTESVIAKNAGDYERALELRAELGLGQKKENGQGYKNNQGQGKMLKKGNCNLN